MSTLLLSDLHLPPEPSPLREGFIAFLRGPARNARAVYLLGDLFEYWIGDDVGLPAYADEVRELRALSDSGVALYFQHGNRDFLVGKAFARATGVQLLRDPVVVNLEGENVLLSHGDLFCTDDVAYQRWRRFSRNPIARLIYSWLPRSRRERIAGGLRTGSSRAAKRGNALTIMDVNEAAVRAAFTEHGITRMIHGHTHRPAEHVYDIDGQRCERIVLADWHDEQREYLEVTPAGMRRRPL